MNSNLPAAWPAERVPGGPGLLEAVAELGRIVDANSRPDDVVGTVHEWARRLGGRLAPDASSLNRLRMLNHYFYGELGFRGESNATCADGAYLHRVIDRRAGADDILAVLYIEIGRAIGLRLRAVALGGGFLVKLRCSSGVALIDVSDGGRTLSEEQLQARFDAEQGVEAPLRPCLDGIGEAEMLVCILRGLKRRHVQAGQWGAALAVQTRLVECLPADLQQLLDRAEIYERLDCPRAAAEDLEECLRRNPQADQDGELRRRCMTLQQRVIRLH